MDNIINSLFEFISEKRKYSNKIDIINFIETAGDMVLFNGKKNKIIGLR